MDYNRDKMIDFNNLQFEWARQPDLAEAYERELAEANKAVAEAEEGVEVYKAQAFLKAHEEIKSPVDKVKAAADLDPKYRSAVRELVEAKHKRDLIRAAVKGIDVKKPALENAVSLWVKQYFSTPMEPADYEKWEKARFRTTGAEEKAKAATTAAKEAARRVRSSRTA
jgi:hypothetical protein